MKMNLGRNKITLLLFMFLVNNLSCLGVSDGALKVKGSILDIYDKPINNCTLELRLAKDGTLLDERKISGDFEATFVVSPDPHEYFMAIKCPRYSATYKSDVYKIGGSVYYRKPLNIGKVTLKP